MARRKSPSGNSSPNEEKLCGRDRLGTSACYQELDRNLSHLDIKFIKIDSAEICEQFQVESNQVSIGDTINISEDIGVLKEHGFDINYRSGLLGSGFFGDVYKGVYGPNATQLLDKNCKCLRNVETGLSFAAKVVDFNTKRKVKDRFISYVDVKNIRDSYETEKEIMSFADHENITPLRLAINIGEPNVYTNQTTGVQYRQSQRIYLIMDFAEFGPLKSFVKHNQLTPFDRIKLAQDCFWGLKYLHDNNIAHGDVHEENVLIFRNVNRIKLAQDCFWGLKYLHDNNIAHGDVHEENVLIFSNKIGLTAKWADFGQGCFSKKSFNRKLIQAKQQDCEDFARTLTFICPKQPSIRSRSGENSELQYAEQLVHQINQMRKDMKELENLDRVLYRHEYLLNWKSYNLTRL